MSDAFSGACALPHLGDIRVAGDDATTFLQGQLTQDVALLGTDRSPLAAY
ncbi:MAG: folate-binding protein, partial [Actinobacteria bacterium]|nr:folate-binding protein [Actinomycetota bacterium]